MESQIYVKDSSGTGQEQRLTDGPNAKFVEEDWSRDGRYILYEGQDPKNEKNVLVLPLEGDRKPIPILHTQFDEQYAQFSPDGKWIAYQSDESGTGQVYIQRFPPSGGKWRVSTAGGSEPRWRGDGKELYFRSSAQIWAAGIRLTGGRLDVDAPRALFPVSAVTDRAYNYDVTRDGQHFVVLQPPEEIGEQANAITVVTNWQAGLR